VPVSKPAGLFSKPFKREVLKFETGATPVLRCAPSRPASGSTHARSDSSQIHSEPAAPGVNVVAETELDMRDLLQAKQPVVWRSGSFIPRVRTGRATCRGARVSTTNQPVRKKIKVMNRLPCYDRATRRSETAVFASLALVGIISIVFASSAVLKFVDGNDHVVAALSGKPGSVARKTPATETHTTLTNVSAIQGQRLPTATVAPGKV